MDVERRKKHFNTQTIFKNYFKQIKLEHSHVGETKSKTKPVEETTLVS